MKINFTAIIILAGCRPREPEQYSECDALGFALRARHRSTEIKRHTGTETFLALLAQPFISRTLSA
jgi:hypothetical protein